MAQRSLHAITKAYYRSMSCFATDSHTKWPHLQCWGFPHKVAPFCTMWFRQFTKTGHTDRSHPHSTEHDSQHMAYLISKQAIPYQIWSLADSSMTSHITWRNPKCLHHSILAQTTTSILTRVNSHLDGWETISHKDTRQTQHHKGWKDLFDSHDSMAKHNYPV
jgi:hypothetical protein